MDDTTMSEDALKRDLVLEKFQEHRDEDDARIEKLHKDAVEGKLRAKRRDRGVGLEDSESEDEDEGARMARLRMKKRKIDGDDLEILAQQPETRPFYEAYQQPMVDDNAEFEHLLHDEAMDDAEDAEDGGIDDDDDRAPRETVSTTSLMDEVREAARSKRHVPTLDPHDVSWVDRQRPSADDDDYDDLTRKVKIREVSTASRRGRQATSAAAMDVDTRRPARRESERDMARLTMWAKDESFSRQAGGSASGAGGAVTGLGRKPAGAWGAGAGAGAGAQGGERAVDGRGSAGAVRWVTWRVARSCVVVVPVVVIVVIVVLGTMWASVASCHLWCRGTCDLGNLLTSIRPPTRPCYDSCLSLCTSHIPPRLRPSALQTIFSSFYAISVPCRYALHSYTPCSPLAHSTQLIVYMLSIQMYLHTHVPRANTVYSTYSSDK